MPTTHMYSVYFVEYTLQIWIFGLVCLECTKVYGRVDVWDVYDTKGFKIGLFQSIRVYIETCANCDQTLHRGPANGESFVCATILWDSVFIARYPILIWGLLRNQLTSNPHCVT